MGRKLDRVGRCDLLHDPRSERELSVQRECSRDQHHVFVLWSAGIYRLPERLSAEVAQGLQCASVQRTDQLSVSGKGNHQMKQRMNSAAGSVFLAVTTFGVWDVATAIEIERPQVQFVDKLG